ncbi:MAG TPA: hypothetical protein VMG61_00280 [Usitatibacter sp.]|nr:hypothetical protein [Usitatibacter sp.]
MRTAARLLLAACAAFLAMGAAAETLYAVSVRTYADPGYHGVEGNLYVVDPDTASTTLVAPLMVGGKTPIGLRGLAIHPKTGVFYGITGPNASSIPRSLVTIDPTNGVVTLVGDLGYGASDIEFDNDGTLYAWVPETRQIGIVNLDNGAVTLRGQPLERGAMKGSFSFVSAGKALVASTGGNGTLDSVDLETGKVTTGPQLNGAPFADFLGGLTVSARGTLYAINSSLGRGVQANLVTIDPQTGHVTNLGALPNDTESMAFGPTIERKDMFADLMQWRTPMMVALFVFAVIVLLVLGRAPKGR